MRPIEISSGINVLHIAAVAGNVRIFEFLVNAGADSTAPFIFHAALQVTHQFRSTDSEIVEWLLRNGFNQQSDERGDTPLLLAIKNNNMKVAHWLASAQQVAASINAQDSKTKNTGEENDFGNVINRF